MNITINNLPNYAKDYDFIVARKCDGELWFYGAYKTVERAVKVAVEVDGYVINTPQLGQKK